VTTETIVDAEIGKVYRVTFSDCCVEGSFEAELVSKNYVPDPPDPDPFLQDVTFGNGVTISGCVVTLTEGTSPAP